MSNQPKNSSQRILVLYPGPAEVKTHVSASTTGSAGSGITAVSKFLNTLTGTAPARDITNLAGYTSHPPLQLTTKYYDANVGIWCDELPNETSSLGQRSKPNNEDDDDQKNSTIIESSTSSTTNEDETTLSTWLDQMCSSEAKEVRAVIGAVILVLPYRQSTVSSTQLQLSQVKAWVPYIQGLSTLRDQIEDETGRELASLVVITDQTPEAFTQQVSAKQGSNHSLTLLESFEDECLSGQGILGWDYIQIDEEQGEGLTDRNQNEIKINAYGEKTGIDRVVETLQAVDWLASATEDYSDGDEGSTEREMDLSFLDDMSFSSFRTFQSKDESGISRSEQELQREMVELKMAMLDTGDDDEGDQLVQGNREEDFGGFSSAFDTALETEGRDDDVWAALDHRDKGQDMLVDNLPSLIERVVAIREAGTEMSSSEREKFAKREIGRLMKEL